MGNPIKNRKFLFMMTSGKTASEHKMNINEKIVTIAQILLL